MQPKKLIVGGLVAAVIGATTMGIAGYRNFEYYAPGQIPEERSILPQRLPDSAKPRNEFAYWLEIAGFGVLLAGAGTALYGLMQHDKEYRR